jgi:hypothetical protein
MSYCIINHKILSVRIASHVVHLILTYIDLHLVISGHFMPFWDDGGMTMTFLGGFEFLRPL